MELTENSVWILPALELNLCLHMLGAGDRQVLPVAASEIPLNRRMLNSFLYLLELGLVEPEGTGFKPSAKMLSRLRPVAQPRGLLRVGEGEEFSLALYFGEDAVTLAEARGEDGQSCRLSAVPRETLRQELASLLKERGMESPELELLSPEGALIRKEKLPAAPEQREEVLRSVLEDAEKIGKTEQDEGASRPAAGGDAEANTAGGRTER